MTQRRNYDDELVVDADDDVETEEEQQERQEMMSLIIDDIMQDFDSTCEALFDSKLAFHTTTSRWMEDIDMVEAAFPDEYFGTIDYPASFTTGKSVKDIWNTARRPLQWKSVLELKKCVLASCRPLMWKSIMCFEIENLALRQVMMQSDQGASTICPPTITIDKITNGSTTATKDTRNSDELEPNLTTSDRSSTSNTTTTTATTTSTSTTSTATTTTIVDTTDSRNAAASTETTDINTVPDASNEEINVLHRIIAMAFDRHPQLTSTEEQHYTRLAELHLRLTSLWISDFNSLPPDNAWKQ